MNFPPCNRMGLPAGGKALLVVEYRSFRNTDAPHLVEIWNETFTGRGTVHLRHANLLEVHALAKPYFDPQGLIVAVEDRVPVGFAHGGFGPNNRESMLSFATGVVCAISVRPRFQGRGIGSELLARCETYLRDRGARTLQAGQLPPLTPYYFGLYGGSDLPGFLVSNEAAGPFLEVHGYQPGDTCLVLDRRLDQPLNIVDARFPNLRRRFEVQILPPLGCVSWWREAVLGPVELLECRLIEKSSDRTVGRAQVWEMEGFSRTWNVPAIGIVGAEIREDLRRQGLGKFLINSLLRSMQEQYFGLAEVQTPERNQAAVNLFRSLGFEQVDVGRTYRLEKEVPRARGNP